MGERLLILGGGLAGATAALTARARGARVTLVAGTPGALAGWSGRLDAFGPWTEPRSGALPFEGPAQSRATPPTARLTRRARFDALRLRRPHHPYLRLGLDLDDLDTHLRAALSGLAGGGPAPLLLTAPCPAPTSAGTVTLSDGGPSSVQLPPDLRAAPIVWLHIPGASPYPPASLAALLAHQLGRPEGGVDMVEVACPDLPLAGPPTAIAHRLEGGPESATGARLAEAIAEAVSGAPRGALILSPPIWGHTLGCAEAWRAHLRALTHHHHAEALAVGEPVFGLRLWRWLHAAMADRGVELIAGRALDLAFERQGARLSSARIALSGGASRELGDLRAVILATGRHAGGGLRGSKPLREALLGLPLYLGGHVLDNPEIDPTSLLPERPWQDSTLSLMGLGIDARCRPLNDKGQPFAENLFAAGRLIGGTHPSIDGTAQGVDLVTGALAQEASWA